MREALPHATDITAGYGGIWYTLNGVIHLGTPPDELRTFMKQFDDETKPNPEPTTFELTFIHL